MKHIIVTLLFVAACLSGCAGNPAPTFDAEANRTVQLPEALANPGSQAKIRMPGALSLVLVWRTQIGFGGTDLKCAHCGRELLFVWDKQALQCPNGIRYQLDGSVIKESVPEGQTVHPLRTYVVDLDGGRLKILG